MGTILAIDPGNGTGVAIFKALKLIQAGMVTFTDYMGYSKQLFTLIKKVRPSIIVVEKPQIYQPRFWKGDPNDVLSVAIKVGIVIAVASHESCRVEEVLPHKWKGTRPKTVDNAHTLSLLSEEETRVLNRVILSKSKLHNVIDAIGIGLWYLKRS